MAEAGTHNPDNVFAPNARYGTTQMRYVVDNITAHVAPGGLSLTNATTLAEVARIRSDGGVVTFATQSEAAKLAYTDDTNSSKVHVVDLSGGSLEDVASVGALEVSFPVKHLAFSLDGTLLLTVGPSSVTLWKWEEGKAVQHDSLSADEVGVGVAFCPGLETPTFVVAGPTAARFIQLVDDDASDAAAGGGRLRMTRVSSPDASAITSLCWSRTGLWLGLTGGKLGLARLEGTGSVAEAQTVSAAGCFGDENAVITQLEGCLNGGCLAAVNGGERCYWVDAQAAVVAEATLGAAACSVAMPPGASAGRKDLFLVASLRTPPGAFARVPAWPAANKANLTEDVEVIHAAGEKVKSDGAPEAGVIDIMRSAATLNQVPSLVEVQTLLNRVPSLKQIAKVPSLKELNARVTITPPVTAAKAAAAAMPPPPPVAMPAPAAAAAAPAPAGSAPCGVDADGNPAPCPGKVCANCRTQKTPLWRNGPLGPKTLCNACGVRYKLGKLPPPGGFPPGHVPPPAPIRKRPALLTTANGNPLKRHKGEKKGSTGEKKGKRAEGAGADGAAKKKRRLAGLPTDGPLEEYVRGGKIGKSGGVLTEYDGAVLLMVLAGLYSH